MERQSNTRFIYQFLWPAAVRSHPVAVLMLGNSVDQTLKATTIALGADRQTHHQHSVLGMKKGNYTGKGYRVGAYPIHPLVFVLHMQQYRKNVVYRSTTSKPARPDVCQCTHRYIQIVLFRDV